MADLDALFYPYTICLDETTLKYLLLLYDRILYLPIDNTLNPGHTSLSKRWSQYDSVLISGFGTKQDADRALMYSSEPAVWDDPMKRLMEFYDQLEHTGICVALREPQFEDATRWHPLVDAVDGDIRDRHFMYQNGKFMNTASRLLRPAHFA